MNSYKPLEALSSLYSLRFFSVLDISEDNFDWIQTSIILESVCFSISSLCSKSFVFIFTKRAAFHNLLQKFLYPSTRFRSSLMSLPVVA